MVESDFNRIVQKTLNSSARGWCYKIPDPGFKEIQRGAAKRPMDLAGVLHGRPFWIESKLQKGLSAFNFKSIRDHQHENLGVIRSMTDPDDYVGLFIAFWEPRTLYEFLFIDYNLIEVLQKDGVGSILKKALTSIRENGYFIKVKKNTFDVEELKEKKLNADNFFSAVNGKQS